MQPETSSRQAPKTAGGARRGVVLAALLGLLLGLHGTVGADSSARARLQHDPRYILESVARQMNVTLRDDEPLPRIHFESSTPLAQFQDAVAPQWHFRPPMIANVYVVARNEIYLADDPDYYRRLHRTLDESLAHEFAHYLQVRYFAANLSDESCETAAIAVQFAFREQNRLSAAPGEMG